MIDKPFLHGLLALCVMSVLSVAPQAEEAAPFPLLLSPDELAARLDDVTLVDIRSAEDFLEKRLPQSVWLSSAEFFETRNAIPRMLPEAEALATFFSERGIPQDVPVVIYGANEHAGDMVTVARAFWAFETVGYDAVAILDGGLARWEAEGHDLVSEPPPPRPQADVTPTPEGQRAIATKADVKRALENDDAVLVDARPANQYSGAVPVRGIERRGHIPGAHNIVYSRVVTMPHAVFKSPEELKELLYGDGICEDTAVIVYCNAGSFSSLHYVAYRLLGHDTVANYDGSMMEWAEEAALPVSTDARE